LSKQEPPVGVAPRSLTPTFDSQMSGQVGPRLSKWWGDLSQQMETICWGRTTPGVVRAEGFEPPRLSSLEPKSSASTSSATPAMGRARREPIRRAARLISWQGTTPHQKNSPARGRHGDGSLSRHPARPSRAPKPAAQILAATRFRPPAAAAIVGAIPRRRLRPTAPPRWSPAVPPDCSRPQYG
jgi:hypothetical protein